MKRLKAVIVKEFAHILRDPTSLAIIFIMPLLMLFIFGYSVNFDLETIETGIIDYANSEISKELVQKFANNHYFVIQDLKKEFIGANPVVEGEKLLRASTLKQIIIIPANFSRDLKNGGSSDLGIIIDGSDSNVANLVYQYNEQILMSFMSDFRGLENLIQVKTKILFNPELKSAFFFIPGVVAILLVMISAILTSLSISRERESGSIDLIFISPLKSWEIILGKTIPYIFVSFIVGSLTLLVARFWFGIPLRGDLLVLAVFALLYIISGLSMGTLISTIAPSQKEAMFAALLSTMLPSIMLSGFIFPLASMPLPLRIISHIVPARYFIKIIRGLAVKGAGIQHFFTEGAAMIIFALVLMTIAGLKFSKNRKLSK